MRVKGLYSHLNGLEHVIVHRASSWAEVQRLIRTFDEMPYRPRGVETKPRKAEVQYDSVKMSKSFVVALQSNGWGQPSSDDPTEEPCQRIPGRHDEFIKNGARRDFTATNLPQDNPVFVKDRIGLGLGLEKYTAVVHILVAKQMALYVGDVIDVGIEVLPMKELQELMSSRVPNYEGALYDLVRQGRGSPAVPLVIIGVAC